MIMVTAASSIVGVSPAKRLFSSTLYYSDICDKFPFAYDFGILPQHQNHVSTLITNAKKISSSAHIPGFDSKYRDNQSLKALKEHVSMNPIISSAVEQSWFQTTLESVEECEDDDDLYPDCSVEAILLLQKSLLEKQLALHFERSVGSPLLRENVSERSSVISSGSSARQRRVGNRRKTMSQASSTSQPCTSQKLVVSKRVNGYVRGVVREELLTHSEVVRLSKKIRTGLSIEEHKSRLQKKLGCEPLEEQLALSLKMSCAELRSINLEFSLAREKLTMSNVRLVMSIAHRYNNMGTEMADLVQGGLIGLLRGIEKFDSSKGCKISTYVYWWIRQGVSRALVESSRTLRLPAHLHERLGLIRNAKIRLEDKGITPTIDKIAETLNMSIKKIRNATEANNKVFSLDREVFPSLNGLPGETYHNYIGDTCLQNIPWNGVDEWALKNEVINLINSTLGERERDIIRLYYGLDNECLTWEDISKRIGLSRERVRQIGLVALEKLKNGARKKKMDALLLK